MKTSILVATIALGLWGGYHAAPFILPASDRVQRIATLFREICIANRRDVEHTPAILDSMTPYDDGSGESRWIDLPSASFITLEPRRCTLETAQPFALSPKDARDLLPLIEQIVARELPERPYDPGAVMGPISKGWLTGAVHSMERWGVFYTASPRGGESAGSKLSLASPRG